MIWIALAATWWAGVGLVVGANRARVLPGPFDLLSAAVWWAFAWPGLLIVEASFGE